MTWQETPYLPLLLLSAGILAALGIYAWRYRRVRGAMGFIILMFGGTAWALSYGLQLAAADLATKLFWIPFIYVGILLQPVGYLLLALQHTGRESAASRRLVVGVAAVHLGVLILVVTNPVHGLVFSDFDLVRSGGMLRMRAEPAPVYHLHVLFSYTVLVLTMVYLALNAVSAPPLYRKQAATLILGWLVPTAGNLIYLFGSLPEPRINPTPFLFPLSGAILAVGIFRFGLLNVVPVARDVVIEGMTDGILVLDAENRIVDANPAAQRLLGGWRPDMIGRAAPDALASFAPVLDQPLQGEVFRELRAGEADFGVRLSPINDPLGRSVGTLMVIRDVTEEKRTETALRLAQQEAEEANRGKSEFLSRMSHELRTPMNSILGFAQLLAKKDLLPDHRRSVDHILKAGEHLLRLINEVLDLARIESDGQRLSVGPVPVASALQEALSLIRPSAACHDCEIDEAIRCDGASVLADRHKLVQVLVNLLSNAVKYNRAGGRVWLSCEVVDGRVRIQVHDTGPGIAPDQMGLLFVPFARLGAENSGVEGTGLGLALSKRLAEAMGGQLGMRTTPGEGSTFWIELARADTPPEPSPSPTRSAAAARPHPPGRPATLLYIEDNPDNLTLVETVLASRPEITLVSAVQGQLGLDLALETPPDLILLDLHLPDLPGEEVLRRLQADARTREIPVIVISADATSARVRRLRQNGARAYLTKPFSIDDFLATVDATLESGGG